MTRDQLIDELARLAEAAGYLREYHCASLLCAVAGALAAGEQEIADLSATVLPFVERSIRESQKKIAARKSLWN